MINQTPFLTFPFLDPVLFSVGPLSIRWYGLSYVLGILGGVFYINWLSRHDPRLQKKFLEDFIPWIVGSIVVGGRLGYVLFYGFSHYLQNPLEILFVWKGGMAFHGGFLGLVLATYVYSRRAGVSPFLLGDYMACAAPIGLFFGRIANFINGEVCGRVTNVSWAVVFPHMGPWPRHPSQIYEALLEGVFLGLFLFMWIRRLHGVASAQPGFFTGLFLIGYGLTRCVAEIWRQPNQEWGFFLSFLTMGQILSFPLIILGFFLIKQVTRKGLSQ